MYIDVMALFVCAEVKQTYSVCVQVASYDDTHMYICIYDTNKVTVKNQSNVDRPN